MPDAFGDFHANYYFQVWPEVTAKSPHTTPRLLEYSQDMPVPITDEGSLTKDEGNLTLLSLAIPGP